MNALNDNHRRTSISQLLNPLGTSHNQDSFPNAHLPPGLPGGLGLQPHHEQGGPPPFDQPFNDGASFHLRAASWDQAAGTQNGAKRKGDDDHGSRMVRTRVEVPGVWPSNEMGNIPYNAPVLSPMYSDERTALSGDFPQNNQYNHTFTEQTNPPAESSAWQTSERVSVRLVARSAMQESASQAPSRYMQPYFHHGVMPYPAIAFAAPPPPPAEEASCQAPKAKRSRAKSKGTAESTAVTGSSKRGYNAKKRNEAAQIAAQNAQLMPVVSYSSVAGDKSQEGPSEAPASTTNADASNASQVSGPLQPELQFARCMSNRYRADTFPRCVSCTRRWAGDTCRFQGIRFFLKDNQKHIVGISFVEDQKADAPSMDFPVKWNIPLTPVHIRRIKRTIARALLPTLQKELEHLQKKEIIRRPRESEVRATCDTCMTSLFSSSYMCRRCGREACAECFAQVWELTMDKPGASGAEIAALQSRREKHAHSNPFFLSCTKRNEHQASEFCPVSRFCKDELAQVIRDMQALLAEPDVEVSSAANVVDPASNGVAGVASSGLVAATSNRVEEQASSTVQPNGSTLLPAFPESSFSDQSITRTTDLPAQPEASILAPTMSSGIIDVPDAPFRPSTYASTIPCHDTLRFADSELNDDLFRSVWTRGHPIVVTGLLPKFKVPWTPEYFTEKYGTQSCLIVECQTDASKRVTVGEFFSWFGKYENRNEYWKLKDWPPSTEFKKAFPELYDDFCMAVPVPNYVRCDGALNIASHFPANTIAPDLGPKMYNALASSPMLGSKGTTRLHMDMADALNIMTFASPAPDGGPGSAAWDLFRAEDSDKIRKFLRKKFQGTFQHDPVHSQHFYLDETLRQQLHDEFGVKSHRVYQRPGEAVFIPAGCAHQVVNLADCIKVAVDFVSPENIDRCEKLTREFREQNQSMVWKEDVLQLRSMMWFAWLSCCRQESSD